MSLQDILKLRQTIKFMPEYEDYEKIIQEFLTKLNDLGCTSTSGGKLKFLIHRDGLNVPIFCLPDNTRLQMLIDNPIRLLSSKKEMDNRLFKSLDELVSYLEGYINEHP